jgi:hypothetical protein
MEQLAFKLNNPQLQSDIPISTNKSTHIWTVVEQVVLSLRVRVREGLLVA